MNNKSKIIKMIFVVIILIIGIIIALMNIIKNEVDTIEDDEIPQDTIVDNRPIDKLNTYFIFDLEKVINSWCMNIESKDYEKILNVLENDYENDEAINTANIAEKLEDSYSEFLIQEVYSSENENNGIFYIYGLGKEDKKKTLEDIYFIINVDYENYTYNIKPSSLDEFSKAKKGNAATVEYKQIAQNADNNITITEKTTEELIQKYMYDYKNKINYDIEKAYECLDDNMKKQKFRTIESYEDYIEKNEHTKEVTGIDSYSKQIKDSYIEYTLKDNNGINYTINAKELMNYKIIIH